jgi:hypothetical protein
VRLATGGPVTRAWLCQSNTLHHDTSCHLPPPQDDWQVGLGVSDGDLQRKLKWRSPDSVPMCREPHEHPHPVARLQVKTFFFRWYWGLNSVFPFVPELSFRFLLRPSLMAQLG